MTKLEHQGVKGMKWGKRKTSESCQSCKRYVRFQKSKCNKD